MKSFEQICAERVIKMNISNIRKESIDNAFVVIYGHTKNCSVVNGEDWSEKEKTDFITEIIKDIGDDPADMEIIKVYNIYFVHSK